MSSDLPAGTCFSCEGTFSKGGMTNHLDACLEEGDGSVDVVHLVAVGRYRPEFWIHLEVAADASLEALDRFLRDLWLDCCGHMSAFTIEETRYAVRPMDELDERGMDVSLETVLEGGIEFTHEYDYGTTTELSLRAVDIGRGDPGRTATDHYGEVPASLLARNEPPEIQCGNCEEPATVVCGIHAHEPTGWRCDACQSEHECEPDMHLPVVNSPRVGMCGYGREIA